MERTKLHQSFALNNCGDLVSIRDVDNGKACGCHCPGCGEHLIARQGQINTWHFAHCGSDWRYQWVQFDLILLLKLLLVN